LEKLTIFVLFVADSDESDGRFLVDFTRKTRASDTDSDENGDVAAAFTRKASEISADMRDVYTARTHRDDDEPNTTDAFPAVAMATEQRSTGPIHYQHVHNDGRRLIILL
jgi:hypothetical protein